MLPLLDVQHLTVSFGDVPVVRDLSFRLFKGRTLCLVGESGSGKSMTAFSLMRLVPSPGRISAGSLMFEGEDLLKLEEKAMRSRRGRDISMIFQEPMTSLNPVLRIGRQIAEPMEIHQGLSRREALEKAAVLMEMVGIPDPQRRLADYPHQFSGGMPAPPGCFLQTNPPPRWTSPYRGRYCGFSDALPGNATWACCSSPTISAWWRKLRTMWP